MMHQRHCRKKFRFPFFFWDYNKKIFIITTQFSFFSLVLFDLWLFSKIYMYTFAMILKGRENTKWRREKSEVYQEKWKNKKERKKEKDFSTATEIVIMDQHGVQLRKRDEFYLSGRSDQELHHYSSRTKQKTSSGGRVVRSLKYHLVTAYWRARVPPNSPRRNLVHDERARDDPRCYW